MEEKDIRTYAEILRDLDLTALEVGADGSVRIERTPAPVSAVMAPAPVVGHSDMQPTTQQEMSASTPPSGNVITSPMIGMFYVAPAENAEPFVSVGDEVKPGDVLCIIEAMKLMNEITAEVSGTIAEVLVPNGAVVEFGQPLFRLC